MILSWFLSDAAAIAVSLSRGAHIMRRRGALRKARGGLDRDPSRLYFHDAYEGFPHRRSAGMCRNIKTLANFAPPATDDEIRASALQFVRKLSGTARPSQANEAVFNRAVDDVTKIARQLIDSLTIKAPPRNREDEARKARERAAKRFG